MLPEVFIDEILPGKKLKDEIRSKQCFACNDGAGQEEECRATQEGNGEIIPSVS